MRELQSPRTNDKHDYAKTQTRHKRGVLAPRKSSAKSIRACKARGGSKSQPQRISSTADFFSDCGMPASFAEVTTNEKENDTMNDTDNEEKKLALAKYLECEPDELSEESHDCYGMTVFSLGSKEYAVATDEEADEAWDQSLDSYIEECITPEIDKLEVGNLSAYIKFDEEMWKRDARMDGRGHSLSSYDGNEEELEGDFYAFRIN
jgi:hypothetical protein